MHFSGDAQRIDCYMCGDQGGPDRIDSVMTLCSTKLKQYEYGDGTTLNFKSIDGVLHSAVVYGNHPFYKEIEAFNKGDIFQVSGWKVKTFENGNCLIELTDVPDLIKHE